MGPETAVIGTASADRGADLAYLGGAEALVAFASRSLSPVELLEALIERAGRVEPAVNAFAETMYEEVQIAGPPSDDLTAFRLAAEVERVAPWNYDLPGGFR